MDILFSRGDRAFAEEIRERLDPPSYSAAGAMLAKLEAKGFVRHHERGQKYVCTPTKCRASAQRSALN